MYKGGNSSRVPEEGSILEGRIVRIEPYGAFCSLDGYGRLQGLIHVSQLLEEKVEKVEDVVSVDEHVWIKIVQVEMDSMSQRWRIRLSMKDVSQDGNRIDLGRERENREQQRGQLETNLNSMIGMGVARDPMANRLILKHDMAKKTTFRGGYSLVADDEGEPEGLVAEVNPAPANTLPPVGRGRGATLPAWMTQKTDGPTGANSSDSNGDHSSARRREKQHKKKKKRIREKKQRKRRERDYSDNDSLSSASSGRARKHRRRRESRKRDYRKEKRKRTKRSRSEESSR